MENNVSDYTLRQAARKVLLERLNNGLEPDAASILAMDVLRLPSHPEDDIAPLQSRD